MMYDFLITLLHEISTLELESSNCQDQDFSSCFHNLDLSATAAQVLKKEDLQQFEELSDDLKVHYIQQTISRNLEAENTRSDDLIKNILSSCDEIIADYNNKQFDNAKKIKFKVNTIALKSNENKDIDEVVKNNVNIYMTHPSIPYSIGFSGSIEQYIQDKD